MEWYEMIASSSLISKETHIPTPGESLPCFCCLDPKLSKPVLAWSPKSSVTFPWRNIHMKENHLVAIKAEVTFAPSSSLDCLVQTIFRGNSLWHWITVFESLWRSQVSSVKKRNMLKYPELLNWVVSTFNLVQTSQMGSSAQLEVKIKHVEIAAT